MNQEEEEEEEGKLCLYGIVTDTDNARTSVPSLNQRLNRD